jgi:hypothetical protein
MFSLLGVFFVSELETHVSEFGTYIPDSGTYISEFGTKNSPRRKNKWNGGETKTMGETPAFRQKDGPVTLFGLFYQFML